MSKKQWITLITFVLFFLIGCAGRNFVRPDPDSLILGKTTYEEIIGQFGKPAEEGSLLKNEKMVKIISYSYSSAIGSAPLIKGVTPGRAMSFYFLDDLLVGYDFVSSFKEDHSNFDETKVSQIKKGATSQALVIDLLGEPTGVYIYPLIDSEKDKALVYLYGHVKEYKIYQKSLIVSVGSDGLVTDVNFATSGQE